MDVDLPELAVRVHVEGVKVPVLLVVRVTIPVGLDGVEDVSLTLTAHVVDDPATIDPGEHANVVVVGASSADVTVIVVWPELGEWVVSPPYSATMVTVPITDPVTVIEHVVDDPDPPSVQLMALKFTPPVVPDTRVLNVTVPVGVVGLCEVSATVAVQVLDCPKLIEDGTQATLVVVEAGAGAVTVTLTLVAVVVAPSGEPVTVKVSGPVGVKLLVVMVNVLVPVGETGFVAKLQVTPVGSGVMHESVTG